MKIDPRVKMLMALCLSGLALLYSTPGQLLLIFAITITLLFVFHFDIMTIGKYLRPFITLLLIIFLVQCFFTPGGYVLLSAGRMTLISSYGLQTGMAAVLRILVVTAAAMLLTTFNSRDMVLGLVQWKVPYEIAFMVSVALRFLPLFRDEMQNVVTAVQLRGVELKKVPWGQKMAVYRALIFPVVYRSMLKAQQLAVVMETRGFRAFPRRTYLRRLHFSWQDYLLTILSLAMTLILVVFSYY